MFLYCISPIDIGWDFLPTVENFVKEKLFSLVEGYNISPQDNREIGELKYNEACLLEGALIIRKLCDCMNAFLDKKHWEGDCAWEPRIFFIPGDVYMEYGFVWKQCNNGTTFVASPVKLDHLSESFVGETNKEIK